MRPWREAGFTLIELLAATAVAGVAMAGALLLVAGSVRALRESGHQTTATLVAVGVVEQCRGQNGPAWSEAYPVDVEGRRLEHAPGAYTVSWRRTQAAPGRWSCDVRVNDGAGLEWARLTLDAAGDPW
jgi:prepilin-type N-terminal cleavage/methylation domain-containing protein